MSYSNGLGNLQQLLGNLATNASRNSTATEQPSASTTQTTTAASKSGSVDQALLSSASGLVSKSVSGSDVRLGKVVALQQVIADGSYNVSAGDVASSIIASLLG